MREIQTEIRRDRIENDNRKNKLQSKAKSGIKTAEAKQENKQETSSTQNSGTSVNIQTAATNSKAEKVQYTRTWDELKPLTSDDFSNLSPSVQNVVESFKEWSDKEASMPKGLEIKGLEDIEKGTVVGITQGVSEKTGQKTIQNQIKHDDIENGVERNIIQSKAESGIKTKKDKFSKIKSNVKVRIAETFRAAAVVGSVSSKIVQSATPSGGDDLSSESASKVKEATLEISSKSLYAVKEISEK